MQGDKSIFKPELDEKGIEHIRRIYQLIRLIFWVSLAVNLCIVYFTFDRFISLRLFRSLFENSGVPSKFLIYPAYILLIFLSTFFHYYYFLRFVNRLKGSLTLNDSHGFNDSFRWLHKVLLFALVTVLINAVQFVITYFFIRV